MTTTFYIASSSIETQREIVQILAKELYQRFGWEWHNNFDWTIDFRDECDYRSHELVYNAKMDLLGARDADVFIFIQTAVNSLGANREYGVRWGQGKLIYRVSTIKDHMFDLLDHVVNLKSIDELVEVLSKREVA